MPVDPSQIDQHRLVLVLVEMVHGLPIAEAMYALDQAKKLISVSHDVDVFGASFTDQVNAYNAAFNDTWRPTVERKR